MTHSIEEKRSPTPRPAAQWLRDCAFFALKAIPVLLWVCWETNNWLIPGPFLILLLGLPIGFAYWGWKDQRYTTHRAFGWLIACLLAFAGGLALHQWQWRESERRAAPLIAALEAYRRQIGAYPTALEALQPRFIAALPKPAFGLVLPYRYYYNQQVEAGHSQYWLSFGIGVMSESAYSNLFPYWHEVD